MPQTKPAKQLGWLACLGVTFFAGALRFWNLSYPQKLLFDETYYAKHGWSLINFGFVKNYAKDADKAINSGQINDALFGTGPDIVVHPEMGKWLIGLGEKLFGMTPFGWRFAAAVVGTMMIFVIFRLTLRLTKSIFIASVAGLLLAMDGMALVLSRLALLDIFLAFFLLAAISCLLADKEWGEAKYPEYPISNWGPKLMLRPWRILAGVWFGCALATKWNTLFVIAISGIIIFGWDAWLRSSRKVKNWFWKAILLDGLPAFGYLVLLPLGIYLLSWTGWLFHANAYEQALGGGQFGKPWGDYFQQDAKGLFPEIWQSLQSLWHYHVAAYDFHTKELLGADHPYKSGPAFWPILDRPVGVDAQLDIRPGDQGCTAASDSTCLRVITLLGNPAVWWTGFLAFFAAIVISIRQKNGTNLLFFGGFLALWLPWFMYAGRPIFSYYSISFLPFLIIFIAITLAAIQKKSNRLCYLAGGLLLVATIGLFVFFFPVWTDGLLTNQHWQWRMWTDRWI